MSVLDTMAFNHNMLNPTGGTFFVHRLPGVNYFAQRYNIPGMSLPVIQVATPLQNSPQPGDKIAYNDLFVQFKVDEDLGNYLSLLSWFKGLAEPETTDQFKALSDAPKWSQNGRLSDVSMIIQDSKKNPNFEILYKDAFPTSISDLVFDITPDDIEYISCTATFAFLVFDVSPLKVGSAATQV